MIWDDEARVGAGPLEPELVHRRLVQTLVDGRHFVGVVDVVVAVDRRKVLEVVFKALVQSQAETEPNFLSPLHTYSGALVTVTVVLLFKK